MPVYQNSVINHRAHCLRVNESVPVSVVIMEVLATKQEYNILSVAQKLCKEQRKYRHRSKESTGFKLKAVTHYLLFMSRLESWQVLS